jgi:hypothetical protein
VFLNSHRWETPENLIKQKKVEKNLTSKCFVDFSGKSFRHGLFAKIFCGVFGLPLPRNALKSTKKKSQKIFRAGWFLESK